MEMTKDEIIKSFKNSGCAKKQIAVIAQLSDTTQTKIKAILEEAQLLPKKVEPVEQAKPVIKSVIKQEPKPQTQFTPELDERILKLADMGLCYEEAAEQAGISLNSFKNRLQRLRQKQKQNDPITYNQSEKPMQAEPAPLIPKSSEPFQIPPIDMPATLTNMLAWVVDNFGTNVANCAANNEKGIACCNFRYKEVEYNLTLGVSE